MTIRNSTALRNAKSSIGQARAFTGGVIELRTNPQPDEADDAAAGTLLGIITESAGAHTAEVQALHLIDLTGITTGETITSITIDGLEVLGATVTYATSATATAALVAAQINRCHKAYDFSATSSSEVVTIKAPLGAGTTFNDATVVAAGTGVWNGAASHFQSGGVAATATPNTWSSGNGRFAVVAGGGTAGVASANGLVWDAPASGVMALSTAKTWTLTWLAAGTLGHFRMKAAVTDPDTDSTSYIRKDGSVGPSVGYDMVVTSTTVSSAMVGTTANLTSLSITEPAE